MNRRRYDEAVGIRRSGGGLGQPRTGLSDSRLGPVDLGIAGDLPLVGDLLALVGDLLALVGGVLALGGDPVRKPRPSRPVAVPDVRGLFYPVCVEVARRYQLQVRVVRLTERPMPVDGLVVGQDPPPGAVRQGGQLTVQIWHPPAR